MSTETQARAVPRQRGLDEAWEQLTDGLFTYCLSVLCDQDAAVAAVREVRRLAVRHRRRLRRPQLLRAWLYALARHSCLTRLDSGRPNGGRPDGTAPAPERPVPGRHTSGHARLRSLAWPETAGTTPAQREALELTGRHGLRTEELAAVLGLAPEQAGTLLAQAVCEVERTAAALSVLAADGCPELRRLGRERGPVLGPALRGELVRHLDSCPTCRGTAEREAALGPWPGTMRAPGALSLLRAPAELAPGAAAAEGLLTQLGRRDDPAAEPRFDRRGFPVQRSAPSQRAALLRQRALAGSVIAAVVAAPVVALCLTGHQRHVVEAAPVSSVSVATPDPLPPGYPLPGTPNGGSSSPGRHGTDVGPAAPGASGAAGTGLPGDSGAGTGAAQPVAIVAAAGPGRPAGSTLSVAAAEVSGRTVITLGNTGTAPVDWQIEDTTPWLRLSRADGTLAAGARVTVLVSVDEAVTPTGPWTARLLVRPCGAVVTLQGPGTGGRRTLPPPVSPPPATPPVSPPPTPPVSPPPTTAPASPPPSSPPPSGTPGGPSSGPTASPTPSPTAPTSGPTGAPPTGSPGAGSPTGAPTAAPSGPAASAPPAPAGRGRHRRP